MQIIEHFREAKREKRDFYIAFFLFFASILSYIENFIPKPMPGIRLGLANSIVLIFVIHKFYKQAFFLSITKVFIISLFTGQFLTIGFLFSLTGSFFSAIFMNIFHFFFRNKISIIGISLIGAFTHISSQLILAYFLLHDIKYGIFFISGILLLSSFFAGVFIGLFANYLDKKL